MIRLDLIGILPEFHPGKLILTPEEAAGASGMDTPTALVGKALIWDGSSGSRHLPAEKGHTALEIHGFADEAQINWLNICSVGNSNISGRLDPNHDKDR